jgi:Resolvase, N terminal domain
LDLFLTALLDGGKWELVASSPRWKPASAATAPNWNGRLRPAASRAADHAKLDRLSRNVAFISALMERKVDFIAVDNPTATKFTIHILAAVAEHERDAIS